MCVVVCPQCRKEIAKLPCKCKSEIKAKYLCVVCFIVGDE
jgi:hypothetical protein